jgi:hypothetical protein
MAEAEGIEPSLTDSKSGVFPLDDASVMAPTVGFEPTTKRLTAARSTTELRRNDIRLLSLVASIGLEPMTTDL